MPERPKRSLLLAAAVVCGLILVGAVQSTPPALTVLSRTTTELTFEREQGYERAWLTIVVRNATRKKGRVAVRYLAASPAGRGIAARRSSTIPPKGIRLVLRKPTLTLEPGDIGAIGLELRRPPGSRAARGLIILRLRGASEASTTVAVSERASAATTVGFEQKDVTLVATAWVGPVARACRAILRRWQHCPGQHFSGTSTEVVARGATTRSTILGSDRGSRLTITLTPANADADAAPGSAKGASTPSDGLPEASVTASGIPRPGKYSGDLAIDPTVDDPKSIGVTVHVQDALIWPLLVILLGAAVGGGLTRVYDVVYRGRKLLRASLEEAVEPYLDTRAQPDPVRSQRFYLDDLLAPDGSEQQFARSIFRRGARPGRLVPQLDWRICGCKSAEDMADLAAELKSTTDRFVRWGRLNAAFGALRKSLDELATDIRQTDLPVRVDGERLLDLAEDEPADDAETTARVARMEGHARLVAIYRAVRKRFAEKDPDWHNTHPNVDPDKLYAAAPNVDDRTPQQTASLRLDLLRAYRLLSDPARLPDEQPSSTASRKKLHAAYRSFALTGFLSGGERMAAGVAIPGLSRITRISHPLSARYESPEAIRRAVRDWDWAVFLGLAILTTLAYVLPLYVGKDYGSVPDYLGAFAAGATVPTLVNWALSPLARSTKPVATAPSDARAPA